jgi:hypothetical protein
MVRGTKSLLVALSGTAALLLAGAAPASAGTLDQQQPDGSGGSYATESGQSLAQTFTAGASGNLDQADLFLTSNGSPTAAYNVQIRNVSGGAPGDSVLASASDPASSVTSTGGFVSFHFATPAPVSSGTQYALVAYSSATFPIDDAWSEGMGTNPYGGGQAFMTNASPPSGPWTAHANDFAFKTYVASPPAPSSPTVRKHCKRKKKHKGGAVIAKKKCKKHKKRH